MFSFKFPEQSQFSNPILNNLITVRSAAELTGYSIQYLRRMLRSGKLPGVKVGQMWFIQAKPFLNYVAEAQKSDDKRFGPQNDQENTSDFD
jgi:excisionase family DNA binding protein